MANLPMERHTDLDEAERLLHEIQGEHSVPRRIDQVSGRLLGRPYVEHPLDRVDRSGAAEVLTISLGGFDCVTYIEIVLALGLSRTVGEFAELLREIRYDGGEVAWHRRNHYMVDWAKNNASRGLILDYTGGAEAREKTRRLSAVDGVPEKTVTFRCFPKRTLPRVSDRIQSGDLVFFASSKQTLDVFHTGLLFKSDDRILLRHATRKAGAVIEQDLDDFLDDHRMAGFILLRAAKKNV